MKTIKRILAALLAVAMIVALAPAVDEAKAAKASAPSVSIAACQINADLVTVTVLGSAASVPAADDGMMYLFAEPTYSAGITTNPIASCAASKTPAFIAELGQGTAKSHLYDKFCIGVVQGGKYVKVSGFCYLSNPQILSAATTGVRIPTATKKGLFPDPARMEQIVATGAQHTSYNLCLTDIIATKATSVSYVYNGGVYYFSPSKLAEYDAICTYCQKNNISMTMVLVTGYKPGLEVMINPLARSTFNQAKTYYMPNASEPLGVNYLAAVCSYLALRYNGLNGYGQIDNFVIGNEVTAFWQWNYMPKGISLASYVEEYAKVLRVAFTAIKSTNNAARVFTSCDQMYNRNGGYNYAFDTRDFLEALAANINAQGNFSWGLSVHPYNVPLTTTTWWSNTKYYTNLVKHNQNTAYLTMENLEVLTDFMSEPGMLTPARQVRPIIIDEIGYSSTQGEKNQAAAIVYAYTVVANNQHIDAMIYHNTTDIPVEVSQGLAEGILNSNGVPKQAYTWFTGMDKPAEAATYQAAAKGVIGGKWKIYAR